MIDIVEVAANISLDHPLRGTRFTEIKEDLTHRIPRGSIWTESVHVGRELHIPFRLHGHLVNGMTRPIVNSGNSERPEFTILLTYIQATHGKGFAMNIDNFSQFLRCRAVV